MKIKSILILSFAFVTFNIYSQDNLKKKENILIIFILFLIIVSYLYGKNIKKQLNLLT